MARLRIHKIELTDDEVKMLKSIISKIYFKNYPQQMPDIT